MHPTFVKVLSTRLLRTPGWREQEPNLHIDRHPEALSPLERQCVTTVQVLDFPYGNT